MCLKGTETTKNKFTLEFIETFFNCTSLENVHRTYLPGGRTMKTKIKYLPTKKQH